MLNIPEVSDLDDACGVWYAPYVPDWKDVPVEFHVYHYHKSCDLISHALHSGAKRSGHGLTIGRTNLKPRKGVDGLKAQRALFACMRSFDPKPEVKISTCGYMLDQWFEEF